MLMAFEPEEQWDSKDKLGPVCKYMFEGYEIIMDVLRQNSQLLEFYNETAERWMAFCKEHNRKNDFKRVIDVLLKHLKIIETQTEDDIKKIPNPIIRTDTLNMTKVVDIRIKALKLSLNIDNWSDSFKIINQIKHIHSVYRNPEFLSCIVSLFGKAKFYLFYSSALITLSKFYKDKAEYAEFYEGFKQDFANKLILAYLMIPFKNEHCNFTPFNFKILSSDQKLLKSEFTKYIKLIGANQNLSKIKIKEYIERSNIKMLASDVIRQLYDAMECDSCNPLKSGQTAGTALKWIQSDSALSEFIDDIKKSITLRSLQHLSKIFKVIKYTSFKKYFEFINFYECEEAIAEGNRLGIFSIKIDPTSQKLTFDFFKPNEFVNFKLQEFTKDMKTVSASIKAEHKLTQEHLMDIFTKAKEKMAAENPEIMEVLAKYEGGAFNEELRKKEEDEIKRKKDDAREAKRIENEEKYQRKIIEQYEIEKKQLKEKVIVERNMYLDARVKEFVLFLHDNNVKTVNGTMIDNYANVPIEKVEESYYTLKEKVDEIRNAKQEEADEYASKFFNEADVTERALRQYEKEALIQDLKRRNETEIKGLKDYLRTKHESDVKMRNLLIESMESKEIYLNSIMQEREQDLRRRTQIFVDNKNKEIKNIILKRAMDKFKKDDNLRKMKEAEELRKQRDREKMAESGYTPSQTSASSAGDTGFTRKGFGTERPQALPDRPPKDRKPRAEGAPTFTNKKETGFSRDGFGKEKPVFTKGGDKGEEGKSQDAPPKADGPPKFTSSGPPKFGNSSQPKFTGAPAAAKTDDGFKKNAPKKDDDSGFKRAAPKPKTEEEQKSAPKADAKPAMKTRKDKNKNKAQERFGSDW